MPTDLEKSIIKTIAYFDVFNFPLTVSEIWKWLYRPRNKYSLEQVRDALENSQWLKERLDLHEAFFSLKDRENIYLLRKQNNNWAERKFKKTVRLIKVFRCLSFIRMIAVCNNLSYSNSRDGSDIDLFIITRKDQIWLARFFALLILKLSRLRPTEEDHRDKFCLTIFVDETALNMRQIMLGQHDIHFVYWLSQFLPVYDPDALYEKFFVANGWIKEYLPNIYPNHFVHQVKSTKFSRLIEKIFVGIGHIPFLADQLYSLIRRLQIKIIDRHLQSMINIDTRVIVNERILKFHSNDRRDQYFHAWKDRVKQLLDNYE